MSHLAAAHASTPRQPRPSTSPGPGTQQASRHRAAIVAGTQAPAAITRESAQVIFCHQACPPTQIFGRSGYPEGESQRSAATFCRLANREWRCWPPHKNAQAELAHIGIL
jgi:hypothetical protein